MSTLKKFITSCSLTFKAFEHEVNMTQNKATLWNFIAVNTKAGKNYAVYCAPKLKNAKSLIKLALKKLPKDTKLVVVTQEYTDDDSKLAEDSGYTIVTLDKLNEYGTEMLEIKQKEAMEKSKEKEESGKVQVVDDLQKEKLF